MSWKPWFSSQKPWKASCAPLSVRSHKSRDYDIKAWCYFNQSNNTISFNLYSSYFHLKYHPLMTPNDLEMTPIWPKNDQKILENGRSNKIFRRKMQFLREFTCLYFSSSHLSIISLVNQSLILGLIFFLFKIFSYEGKKKTLKNSYDKNRYSALWAGMQTFGGGHFWWILLGGTPFWYTMRLMRRIRDSDC